MRAKRTAALLTVVAAAVLAVLAGSIKSAVAAGPTITIWADQDRKAAVTQLATQWATARGAPRSNFQESVAPTRPLLSTN